MKVFITGGTGFVGQFMTKRLAELGHEVSVLTRSAAKAASLPPGASAIEGNPMVSGPWQDRVSEHDVVINLAGASIFTPWTKKARRDILSSRTATTRNVVDALKKSGKDVVLVNASAVGFYGGRKDDAILDESSPAGDDFLSEVAIKWEAEAARAVEFGVRVVLCRFGIVLGRGGGALGKMIPPFKYCLGGPLGSGRQWIPWIHEEDLFRIILFVVEKKNISGPVNCVAPSPVTNKELTLSLGKALGRPVFMPAVPGFILRLLLGEFGSVVLEGQRATPKRLSDEGFEFNYPRLQAALEDLVSVG